MSDLAVLKVKPRAYECPYCLEPVGLLGRGLAWFFGTRMHGCNFSNVSHFCRWDSKIAPCSCAMPCDTTKTGAISMEDIRPDTHRARRQPKPPKQDLPFRISDIKRALILIRTSNNAHGSVNCEILSEKVDSLPDVAKIELAAMLRNIAIGLEQKASEDKEDLPA